MSKKYKINSISTDDMVCKYFEIQIKIDTKK